MNIKDIAVITVGVIAKTVIVTVTAHYTKNFLVERDKRKAKKRTDRTGG